MQPAIEIVEADLENADHAEAVVKLINAYANDAMGDGQDLPEEVRNEMVPGLRRHPASLVFLAYRGSEAVGVAVCFVGFSTFAARPLVNVHDLAVLPDCRRQGVGRRLIEQVESKARQLGCCKVTLEVRRDNAPARHLYRRAGFGRPRAGGDNVTTLFWTKAL